ncbi:hypothetical protein LXA43DRAFT_1060642 [Ganoderma leucocontextum]|nr:hypothetical protein LXA43DRAFT_1060642 [Ganoderma leucocontextum]
MVESRPTPATPQELVELDILLGMMGGAMDTGVALALLRRHGGNMDKTAAALLEGDTPDVVDPSIYADLPHLEPLDAPMAGPRTPPPSRPENAVIDLTKDDDDKELARALQASLEDQGSTTFGPSNRAPDPNWAMVPSNVEAGAPTGMSQDDQAMSRAIEASLSYNVNEDTFEELPLEEKVRKGDTPVVLRPTSSGLVYAALLIHGLAFVPQFRQALAGWAPLPEVDGSTDIYLPEGGPGRQAWVLSEMMTNMDLAVLGELNVDDGLRDLAADPWNSPAERLGDVTSKFYELIVYMIQNVLQYNNCHNLQREQRRLMMLSHGFHDAPLDDPNTDNLSYVKVTVGPAPELNDLVSALAAEFAPPESGKLKAVAKRRVIFEPSDIIAFQLVRDGALPSYDAAGGRKAERMPFRYPGSVYLDQFMRESYDLAKVKRVEQRVLWEEVKELEARKKGLLHYNDKDVLVDLQSCLYYYENVAESDGEAMREQEIKANKKRLAKIIGRIQQEAKLIDAAIESKRTEAQSKLDCPELKQHRYDLRAVLVHDGLYGRNHLYSYVKHKGQWWKTLDYSVTKVSEETVLTDATGLHLSAGPYYLLYSHAVSEEEENARVDWPENFKNSVKHNNRAFLRDLPDDLAARVFDPNSPPTSPSLNPATPSEMTIASDVVEPPESRGEPMDTTD